jgi:predicted unusual protein kinase regulating ubiquinone biosynthesis (AarF/ABC1/UbiB family)
VDKYAEYFLEELDFTKESIRIDDTILQIRTTPVRTSSAIVVPMTYKDLSSEKVLISEWIDVTE